jgi:predicted nucleotidyltransferase
MSPSETGPRSGHDDVIERLVESSSADDRVVAVFLGGSHARGEADEYSDIDLSVIVSDDSFADVTAGRGHFVRELGEVLFLEDFGRNEVSFVILADGTELELNFFREKDLHAIRSGPHRVLLDKTGILAGAEFPLPALDRSAQVEELRRILSWFWHDLDHFTTAIGRNRLWWAAGQLEALRNYCVNLERIRQGVQTQDEPYWKLDDEISTEALGALRSSFVEMEREPMLRAGRDVLAFFRERAPDVARANELVYPTALDALVGGRLGDLDAGPK